MVRPTRTTKPLLDVVACFLRADLRGGELYGWQIMKDTNRIGPTVYGILDRLEDAKWITGYWDEQRGDDNRPRRRFYQLTDEGRSQAWELLASRRPEELRRLSEPSRQARGLGLPPESIAPGGAQ